MLLIYIMWILSTGKESECVQVGCIEAYCGRSAAEKSEAFQNKKITFHEDGKDVYNVSMEQLGYSLQDTLLKH